MKYTVQAPWYYHILKKYSRALKPSQLHKELSKGRSFVFLIFVFPEPSTIADI